MKTTTIQTMHFDTLESAAIAYKEYEYKLANAATEEEAAEYESILENIDRERDALADAEVEALSKIGKPAEA